MARPRGRDIAAVKRLGHVHIGIAGARRSAYQRERGLCRGRVDDGRWARPKTAHQAGRHSSGMTTERAICQNLPSIDYSRIPFLDSSLRWNDNGGRSRSVAIPTTPILFLPNA